MTTITTVLGLAPLVVFSGSGAELYRGLGAVVLGGLAVSTVFTLVLVPTVFSLMMGLKATLARLLGLAVPAERLAETRQQPEPAAPRRPGTVDETIASGPTTYVPGE
jgi:HAE1 family hydrophobic/amphiphilic exporter-1